jgi:hypothetical protein
LVDEEEATVNAVWTQRINDRMTKASEILFRQAGLRFVIREFRRWDSDDRLQDFSLSLREFESKVAPGRSKLAIGFSSQYKFSRGRHHLGGTRGPLSTHILLRENAPSVAEPERLEVLVHELGHYLGAAHSAAGDSVMRPVVGDGQARSTSFQIRFDPHNAAIIRLVAQEIRLRHLNQYTALSTTTLAQLRPHYVALRQKSPLDPTAPRFLAVIDAVLQLRAPHAAAKPAFDPAIRIRVPEPSQTP